ncbi:MAG TPA: hypothetical protein DD415_01895 [Clostridiales bacterium]|nr:hypothetical protein [Clostridiales bacterium]
MKRFKLALLCASLATAALCGMTACDDSTANDGKHNVTFIYNYADSPASLTYSVEDGGKVEKPQDPTREDYRFKGWYTSVVCTEKFAYDFDNPVNENLRLFAGWSLSNATVTFNLNYEGAANSTASVEVGEKVTRPAQDPVREDYHFDGWYADALGTREFDFNSVISDNTVIYAKWTQTVARVTFVHFDDIIVSSKVEVGQTATRPAQDPEREDYRFVNWYVDKACTQVYDFSAPITADIRIYAGWKLLVATVTLDYNYEGAEAGRIKVNVGSAINKPEDPEREGYNFVGWFIDENGVSAYNFATKVENNISLYAKWELKVFTVTFNANYTGAKSTTAEVKYNQTVEEPAELSRSGYDFAGWYKDSECNNAFDFNTPITADTELFAKWISQNASGECEVKFMLNYGENKLHKQMSVKQGRKIIAPEDPERKGYFFAGWYVEATCENMIDFSRNVYAPESVEYVLYAKWLKGYTFEAEYTYLEGKPGQGSSDNCEGTQLIQTVKDITGNGAQMGMSNGAYVGKLYYNGAFIEFNVTSSEEVFDAAMVLRLTPDLYDMIFTDEEWQVEVNGELLRYGSLSLTGAIATTDVDENGNTISGDLYKRPFENYLMTSALHLKKGNNVIKLITHNIRDHSGTFNAETPLIDCMYLYSNSTLSWTNCYPENLDKTQADVNYDITYDYKKKK